MKTVDARRSAAALMVAALLVAPAIVPSGAAATATPQPEAKTGSVVQEVGTTAMLQGTVTTAGQTVTYYFEYGTSKTTFGARSATFTLTPRTEPEKVGIVVTGLTINMYYRLVVEGEDHVPHYGDTSQYTIEPQPLKVNVSKITGQHLIGASVALAGTLTGGATVASQPVLLQQQPYPYTTAYTTVGAPLTTTSTGRFSVTVPNVRASTHYRFATETPLPIYSDTIDVAVSPKVVLHVKTSSQKGLVRLYGTVSPTAVGAHVAFQLERGSSGKPLSEKAEERIEEKGPSFKTEFGGTVKRATSSVSRFSVVEKIKKTGRYRALVELEGGPIASGYSSTVLLHAAPSKKKHKKS